MHVVSGDQSNYAHALINSYTISVCIYIGAYATPIHTVYTQAHNPSSYTPTLGALLYVLYIRQHYPRIICTVYAYILHMNIYKTTTFIIIPLYHSVLTRTHVCIPTSDVTVTYTVNTYVRIYIYYMV